MRHRPLDTDTLFFVRFVVTVPVDDGPAGAREGWTFAQNWMEASHLTRNQFGPAQAEHVLINDIYTKERQRDGAIVETYLMRRPPAEAACA